jgi:G:T/U-mismatch repair DNA glycosylase
MPIVKHRFLDYKIEEATETLIVGTFNPEAKNNEADFFYSRPRNFLWRLLPTAFGEQDLRGATAPEKIRFIKNRKIDFIDLIAEVAVEVGMESNYDDRYLDSRVAIWTDIIATLHKLQHIKRVCFTRKTLVDIPNMRYQVGAIQQYCVTNNIEFILLKTPARTYSSSKQLIWTEALANKPEAASAMQP